MKRQKISSEVGMQRVLRQVTRLDIIATEARQEAADANRFIELLHCMGGVAVDSYYYLGLYRILPPYRTQHEEQSSLNVGVLLTVVRHEQKRDIHEIAS